MFLFASALAADDDLDALVERTQSAERGPEGCWVGEGHATWARGPWKPEGAPWPNSSHGESDFTAVLANHVWVSTTLTNTTSQSRVDGQPTTRPLLRQFTFALGRDPMLPFGVQWPLLAWDPAITYGRGQFNVQETPETAWVEQDGGNVTVRWSSAYDDGPGNPAETTHNGTFDDERAAPLVIGLEGSSFRARRRPPTARRLSAADRQSLGWRVELDEVGLPTREHAWWEPYDEQTVEWRSFRPCADEAEGLASPLPSGAVFEDELDLRIAVRSAIERERLAHAEEMYRRDRAVARAFTQTGVALLAAAGVAGACTAWCDLSEQGEGVWLGTAVTTGTVGGVALLDGVILRAVARKRWEARHTPVEP